MAFVEIHQICKVFGNVVALDEISISIEKGEFLVLLGPSGCGKTTLLNLVAGLESPTSGSIMIDKKDVVDLTPRARNIGMVFQDYALYPHLNVFENLAFPLKSQRGRFTKDEIKQRVEAASMILDIHDLLARMPRQLSGGQRQRTALGRAIVKEPKLFLMDEPLSNLDAALRLEMRVELKLLVERLATTTLYVTHDQAEAMALGTRIAVLKNGALQQIGTPIEVYSQPANIFVASFVGSAPMNFFPGYIETTVSELVFFSAGIEWNNLGLDMKILLEEVKKEVVLGVRPEDIDLSREPYNGGKPFYVRALEHYGSHLELMCEREGIRFRAEVPPDRDFKVGQSVFASPRRGAAHIFDPETTFRLL